MGSRLAAHLSRRRVATLLTLALGLGAMAIALRAARNQASELHPTRRRLDASDRERGRAALPGVQDVTFTSSDGLRLAGWYGPPKNGKTIVLCHGVGAHRVAMLPQAEALARHGFGVLLFDWRGHGESEGDLCTWGDRERMDLSAALDFLGRQPDAQRTRVGAIGFSIGANAVATLGAQDPRILAFVLEGASTSLRDGVEQDSRHWGWVALGPALLTLRYYGVHVDEVSVRAALPTLAPRPVLLVEGSADPYIPRTEADLLYAAARTPKELFVVDGAGHGHYADAPDGAAYLRRLVDFFEVALASE
jgi:dipeptidyl aminopeptidase/acylaminoacyl peptidase